MTQRQRVDAAAEQLAAALTAAGVKPNVVTEQGAGIPGILAFGVDLGHGSALYISVYDDGGDWRYGVTRQTVNLETGRRKVYEQIARAQDPAIIAMAAKMTIDQTKASA